MKRRIGKIEARAISACNEIKNGMLSDFRMEWRKSYTWGRVAVILYHGEKAAEASGCGYDKESACLAAFLYPLSDKVGGCGGAGFSTVRDHLATDGWKLEHTYNGKWEDGFRIERIPNFANSSLAQVPASVLDR